MIDYRSTSAGAHQPAIILFLAANPSTTTRLRLDEEARAIDQALRQANYRDQFDLGCNRIDLQALDEPSKPRLMGERSDPRQVVFVAFQQTSVSVPSLVASTLSPSQRRRLETQLTELEKRHATLTKRIDALDTDIGRELDLERKLALHERRQELVDERQQVAEQLANIEQQLGR